MVTNSSSQQALVVYQDENNGGDDTSSSIHQQHPANEIVLDALPYVEPLDPTYENYAIQLIEEELLQGTVRGSGGEHPSLQQLLPPLVRRTTKINGEADDADFAKQCPRFGGKAPMAEVAYKALVAQNSNPDTSIEDNNNNQKWIDELTDPMTNKHPNITTISDIRNSIQNNHNNNYNTLIADLTTSISTQKIKFERQRQRLLNLELQQHFQTPEMFTYYNNIQLESQIVQPISQTVERQRMDVDAINATRMEEQQRYMGTLDSLNRKYYDLIEKNLRLREAIVGLEGEVEGLTNEGGE
jgi:hypothetical protein